MEDEVYFDVIGYLPGKPKLILYRKRFENCSDACSHLTKLEKTNSKLFYVVSPEIVKKNLSLF